MSLDKLTYGIEPGLLYGRPGPNKSHWRLDVFREKGLVALVSLVDNPRSSEVTQAGLVHYQLLFEDKISRPYKTANGHVLAILEEFDQIIDRHLPRGQAILVHCNSGKDRTALLLAYYLVTRKGLSAKMAIHTLRRLKPNALSAKGFKEFVLIHDHWMREHRRPGIP